MSRSLFAPVMRLAVVVGASIMAFTLVAPVAQAGSHPKLDVSQRPSEKDFQDYTFGSPNVGVVATVPGVDTDRIDPDVDDWVLGGSKVRVRLETTGFAQGPLTVWIQSAGNVDGVGKMPWRKHVVNADEQGVVTVTVKPGRPSHCSAVWIRVNDKRGQWAEEDLMLVVRRKAPSGTPAVIVE